MEKNKVWFLGVVLAFCLVLVGGGCFWLGTHFGESEEVAKECPECEECTDCGAEVIDNEMKVAKFYNGEITDGLLEIFYTTDEAYVNYPCSIFEEGDKFICLETLDLNNKKINDVKLFNYDGDMAGFFGLFVMEDGTVYKLELDETAGYGLNFDLYEPLINIKVKEIIKLEDFELEVILLDGTQKTLYTGNS